MADSQESQDNIENSTHSDAIQSSSTTTCQSSLPKTTCKIKRATNQPKKVEKTAIVDSVTAQNSNTDSTSGTEQSSSRLQPSKQLISKCRKEFDNLLETIKKEYHNELKDLFSREIYPDLYIIIGESRKPIHRCIFASRIYRLYCAFKAFSVESEPLEKDIISTDSHNKLNSSIVASGIGEAIETRAVVCNLNILNCTIPEELISFDLFLTLARRAYLDQGFGLEEEKLYKKIVDWLKMNKPDLVKVTTSNSPNHRDSFRTIQPDSTSPPESPVMMPEQPICSSEDIESNIDEADIGSSATSPRDVSLTHSLLTRTETFELLSRNGNQDGSSPVSPNKDTSEDGDDKSLRIEEGHAMGTGAPTTRTGLRPKAFSNIVEDGSASFSTETKSKSSPSKVQDSSNQSKLSKNRAPIPRTSLGAPVKSSETGGPSPSPRVAESQKLSRTPLTVKTNTQTATAKVKPTIIANAHPISIERSRSPSTNILKGTGRNFIAANKRLITQIEKKNQAQQNSNAQNLDSDLESIESNLYIVEPLTSDSMIQNLDKFSLVSRSQLAEAMARLFIDGNMSDATVQVKEGQKLKAHVCILAARSAYLAEVIKDKFQSKPWTDTKKYSIEIDLSEFSINSVNFSLMHIYSGIAKVPEDIDLEELTRLSHLLHVTTLNQVCIHNLRMNLCHHFHKPCNVCSLGVLKTLPLAWRYDYSDLYAKCLQWIGSNFATIFSLKEFSELKPHDLVEECYNATLSQLTPDNIIPKTIECQKLLKNLPRVKWTESVICLVGRQLEDFCHYVASNYEKIIQSESFLNLNKNCWECEVLEENLLAAMNHLKPDIGCKTLIQLHKIECSLDVTESAISNDPFSNLITKMIRYCERYLLKDAAAVVHCSSWRHMSPSLQKRIKDQAIITTDFDEPTKQLAGKPKLPSMSRVGRKSSSPNGNISNPNDSTRSSSDTSNPESRLKSPSTTYLPPPKNKTASARHIKVLK